MYKFGVLRDGSEVPFVYPDIWQRQRTTGRDRLVIAPSTDHIGLLLRLAQGWTSDFFVLYVLLVSRIGRAAGRYACPQALTYDEVDRFVRKYAAFLASDGRHHFWIGSVENEGTLVYDNHNVIYAYGPLDRYLEVLAATGLHEAAVRFPVPHTHQYNPQNDLAEEAILSHWAWQYSPLQQGDDP